GIDRAELDAQRLSGIAEAARELEAGVVREGIRGGAELPRDVSVRRVRDVGLEDELGGADGERSGHGVDGDRSVVGEDALAGHGPERVAARRLIPPLVLASEG
ncbi:hypothetical protein, partial [Escherichia coli]|uniref:hypothetical protein n=1 Tax=Escherichia coli TaxID=562 RepID=UPI00159B994D